MLFEQPDRLLRCQRVGHVAEVDARHELFWSHVDQQSPQRLALGLRVQIPHGVDDGRRRQVDDAFLRTDPAELTVAGDVPPPLAGVLGKLFESLSDDERLERLAGRHTKLVASPDRERDPVAFVIAVGVQSHVDTRVIRIGVHRVRAVEAL